MRLLDELRASWPPVPAPGREGDRRGYVGLELAGREPSAALRLGDRFAVALVADADGSFLVVPLVRDDVLVTSWRHAVAGDGLSAFVAGVPMASEASLAVDQTNVSVVVGERAIVKWFRRVGPGPSRAGLLLAHLDLVGFVEIPTPLGFLLWNRPGAADLVLAQGDGYLPDARDGWDWCVNRLERHVAHGQSACPDDCDPWIGGPLGALVARLHAALATASAVISEPVTTADGPAVDDWRLRAIATLEEALALTAAQDRRAASVLEALEPAIRAGLDGAAAQHSIVIQPVHGDLHVGQLLEWRGGLAVIDFDGNPALGGEANALRQPVERDLAQMLSSLDHVGRIVAARSEPDASTPIEDWIARTRVEFLAALHAEPNQAVLTAFEAEQECRELVYAARFLPRWRYAPLATLRARYGS